MAGTPGPVGGIVAAQSWNLHAPGPPGGGSWTQATAWAAWNAQTGTRAQVDKIYGDSGTENVSEINSCIDLGIQAIVCYNPDPTSTATLTADLASFTASVNHLHSIGLTGPGRPGYVVLHQEVELHLTAAQFLAIMQFDPNGTGVGGFHAAANAAGFQLYWDAAGSAKSKWASYFPGAQYLDGIAADFYCDAWLRNVTPPNYDYTYLKTLTDLCDNPTYANGTPFPGKLPFGLMEIGFTGSAPNIPAQADFQAYMAYLIQLFGNNAATSTMPAGRLRRGLKNGPILWYDGANNTVINQIVPMPGNVPYDTYVVQTAYPNLYNALTATGPTPPSVTTTSLPAGTVGTAYSAALSASGGTAPYTWSKTGGSLPPGLSLSAAGVISGTPTAGGTYNFTVTVTDATSLSASANLSILVSTAPPALTIHTTSVPAGVVSTPYSTTLAASGGTLPYTWTVTAGTLPPGLSLASGSRAGAFLNPAAMGAADVPGAISLWETWTGRHLDAVRDYTGLSDFTIYQRFNAVTSTGRKLCLNLKPAYNPVSATDRANMGTMLATMKAAGADVEVSLWAEPYYAGLTSAQYIAMVQYYAATVRQYYPLVFVTSNGSVSNNSENSFYPGDAYIDKVATDYYSISYVSGQTLDLAASVADSAVPPKPFGLWEFNALVNGGNFLTQPDSGFENGASGSIGDWTNSGNATIAATTAQARTGAASLALTSIAAGNMSAAHCTAANITTQGLACVPGDSIQASAWFRAATSVRSVQAQVSFYTSGGVFISTLSGTAFADSTTGWTQVTATVTAPATAAFCRVAGLVQATGAASEIHYIDDALLTNLNQGYTQTQITNFYTYIQSYFTGRATAGKTNANLLQFNGPGPNSTEIQAASDSRIALYDSIAANIGGAAGVISGTPTTAGTYPFTATVTDSVSATASVPLTVTITAAPPPLAVSTKALPAAVVGTPYSTTLGASGGSPPYSWSSTGALPPGLILASTGQLSGTPTTAGTYSPTFTVTDSVPNTASATLGITVTAVVPQVLQHTPAVPGQAQPGAFVPGLQGTAQPLRPLFTPAVPGLATPGAFMPADPGVALAVPPPGPPLTPAVPGQAQPGAFTPGDPGQPLLPPPGPFVVQQLDLSAVANYGWVTAEFSGNAAGNMLVLICGWDVNATAPAAPMPAVYPCDSALNYWVHAGTTTAGNTGSRCTVWVAPNAQPVTWVSLSPTGFVSSLAAVILEVGNAPKLCSVDLQAATSNTAATVLAASPGRARSADLGLTVLTAGSTNAALLTAPAGWAPLGEVQAGVGQPNGTSLWPYWQSSVPAGSNQPVTYQVSTAVPLSAVTVLIEANPSPPVQTDPNFPALRVEAAFGFTPGDLTQSPPTWTDITNRCASKDGTPFIEPVAGKAYELGQPETGELLISCRNNDGQLTPGNVNSIYAPGTGVQLGTPVRVSAWWQGAWSNVAFGYVERWPMDWPDMRHWGMSAMKATDAFSALSAANSYSALSGDMLIDQPAVLIPCNEQYTTQANSLVPQITPSAARGLLAANISRVNQRPGFYVDGTGAQCATGQSTTLLGSQDTGFGCSQFTAPLTATSSGPGMVYWDPNLPSPLAPSGLSVEFWLTITAPAVAANQQPVVFTAFGAASNYQTANPSLQIQVQNFTGNNLLQVTFANGTKMTAPFTPSPNPQQVVIVFGAGTVTLYVNGALAASQALTTGQATAWQACMLGCGNYAYHVGALMGGVFTAMSLGIYPYQLPLQRIASHYVTGVSGQAGVDGTTRIAQLLAWNNLGVPRGGRVTFNGVTPGVLQGPAYSLSGANVSAAVNQVATNEQGMVFAGPDGTLQFVHRWGLFNQAPQAVFGDNPVLGEVPFQPGQAFDYDNSKLGNIAKVQRTTGPTTGVTATVTSPASQAAYFARSLPQTGIQTTSDLDAFDIANLLNSAYSQPQIRLRELTVDAASYPAAFSTVLGLQQGSAAIVNRRPVGGVPISANVIVQKISHRIGPKMWQTSYEMSPYPPLNAVLQLDAPGFNVVGQNALP